jgi:hypothetical protein
MPPKHALFIFPYAHPGLLVFSFLTFFFSCITYGAPEPKSAPHHLLDLSSYNYVVGTHAISGSYKFTKEERDVEASRAVIQMGSNIIKINKTSGPEFDTIVGMPFKYIFIWYHNKNGNGVWYDGLNDTEKKEIYQETYNYTQNLLKKYNHSGKTFFIGHWEGDWLLLPHLDGKKNPPPAAIQGMIEWFNIRQKAIDAAKQDTPHQNVALYHYAEVNRVRDAMVGGKERLVNKVLPFINPDYLSYSAYDVERLSGEEIAKTLDYIQSLLPEKPSIAGKRVFIGEFAIKAKEVNYSRKDHEYRNRMIIINFMRWGCPFILYWEMYNNEVKNGIQQGFWLIDDKNEKWDLYYTFEQLYQNGARHVEEFKKAQGRLPTVDEYLNWAVDYLSRQ